MALSPDEQVAKMVGATQVDQQQVGDPHAQVRLGEAWPSWWRGSNLNMASRMALPN